MRRSRSAASFRRLTRKFLASKSARSSRSLPGSWTAAQSFARYQDMFDLKLDAPVEIRGEFSPIDTKVPGIQICEVFPQLARIMDRCAIIRSVPGHVRSKAGCAGRDPRRVFAD